jgi:uncharacterized membrane protein
MYQRKFVKSGVLPKEGPMGKHRVLATMSVMFFALAVVALCLAQGRPTGTEIATFSTLPSLGRGAEALAVDAAGTTIVGSAWDQSGLLHAVKWSIQGNGSWAITDLPRPPSATSAMASGVNNFGDAAGNDFPSTTSHPILWPATGGFDVLGCADDPGRASVHGISAGAQVVIGQAGGAAGVAAVWRPGGACRENLPGGSGAAYAVNGDGTIVGGIANVGSANSGVPVRWTNLAGKWQIEPLDSRDGFAFGANNVGDLAGYVVVPCSLQDGCDRAMIWYVAGSSRELGTLGGEQSQANDINANGEVVGSSTSPRVGNTAYFWSESLGMMQLPFKGHYAVANALSDVRPDGTRLVVGADSRQNAVVWVVRNP